MTIKQQKEANNKNIIKNNDMRKKNSPFVNYSVKKSPKIDHKKSPHS